MDYKGIEIVPGDGDNFSIAKFAAAVPKDPRAVLVIVPGSSSDGRQMVKWREFSRWAEENNVALVGCYFADKVARINEDYVDAKGGSGKALIAALKDLELGDLPIFLWGHSAGGEFNYEFACHYPKNVAAFVVNKGGIYYTGLAPDVTRKIPAMFFVGEFDAAYRVHAVASIYWMGKVSGNGTCPWRMIVEKNIGHDLGRSIDYSLEMFSEVLEGVK